MVVHNAMRGMGIEVYANQADREAFVLSAIDKQALVEYVMPEGRTFLRILRIDGDGYLDLDDGRSVSYAKIPKKFVDDMRAHFSESLRIFKGGFDADEVIGKKHPTRFIRDRLKAQALAVRCRVLDLPLPAANAA